MKSGGTHCDSLREPVLRRSPPMVMQLAHHIESHEIVRVDDVCAKMHAIFRSAYRCIQEFMGKIALRSYSCHYCF